MPLHLTFDDGPDPRWTPLVLDALRDAGATATFFVLAPAAERHPELVERMRAEGHEVGLHAELHVRHTELAESSIEADTRVALERLGRLGASPRRWRTPWGVVTPATHVVAGRVGLELCSWTLDSEDWNGDDEHAMLARLAPWVSDGAVVLLHDGLGPGAKRSGCAATVALTRHLLALAAELGVPARALAGAGAAA